MKIRSLFLLGVLAPVVVSSALAQKAPLLRSTPEAQGVSSQAVLDFIAAADEIDTLHSFVVLRHGKVIADGWWKPESADKPHVLHSVSKSFNSTAVGLLIHEGKLKLDDHVLKFFPNEAPPNPSDNLKAMTVRDLLTMSGGHDPEPKDVGGNPIPEEWPGKGPQNANGNLSVKTFLAHPVPYKPGTHFLYNTMGSYMLSAIVTKVTGETELEYLKPRLFVPLGIIDPRWDNSPDGYSQGGHGLYLRTEDMAKLGQLYLQKGRWKGRQLVPAAWVAQATSKQIDNENESHAKIGPDWKEGYGFQFWRCRHNAYRADGASGQFIVVMPDQDMVVAITADTGNMQGELNAIWDNLLPAVKDRPLPADAALEAKVKEATAKLVAHPKKKAS